MSATVSIVVPAYNEARRLGPPLAELARCAAARGPVHEVIVVDDGSTDGTARVLREFAAGSQQHRVVALAAHAGKGAAVRAGMLAARGDYVLMCDADLSTPLAELDRFIPLLASGAADIVIGSRDLPEARLDPPQPHWRRWPAWLFRAVRRRLLLPRIRDTQCGFKLFTRTAAREVFALAREDGWLFDCEALALAERLGYRIRELGVTWRNHPDSRVRVLPAIVASLPALLRIRRRVAQVVGGGGGARADQRVSRTERGRSGTKA